MTVAMRSLRLIVIMVLMIGLGTAFNGRLLKRNEDEILDLEYYKTQVKHEYMNLSQGKSILD